MVKYKRSGKQRVCFLDDGEVVVFFSTRGQLLLVEVGGPRLSSDARKKNEREVGGSRCVMVSCIMGRPWDDLWGIILSVHYCSYSFLLLCPDSSLLISFTSIVNISLPFTFVLLFLKAWHSCKALV